MAAKYGDAFSLELGNRLVVLLNGSSPTEEAMHGSSHVDFIPLLRFLPNALLKKLANTINAVTRMNAKMFMDNKATYTNGEVRNVAATVSSALLKKNR